MFDDFAKRLSQKLIAQQFEMASVFGDGVTHENTGLVIFMKNESPILYIVSVVNAGCIDVSLYSKTMADFAVKMELQLDDLSCNHIICLHLLADGNVSKETIDFCDKQENLPSDRILNVWWYANLDIGKLKAGKGQPDKLFGIEKEIRNALESETEMSEKSFSDICNDATGSAAIPERSTGRFLTGSIIAINILVWFFTRYSGLENQIIQDFANSGEMVFRHGQIYRLLTAAFLHGSWSHIAYNCLSIYIFGAKTEKYLGRKAMALVYFMSAIGGNLLSGIMNTGLAIGASGAAYGLIGAVLAIVASSGKHIDGISYFTILIMIISGIGIGFMSEGIDNFGHIGGLAVGFVSGKVLWLRGNKK